MSKDVFISYKSEEFEEASWVRSVLESNGISCWMAPSSIPGGSNYAIEIPQAIKQAKVFVLILSSKAQSSQWISREVDRAINEGKILLPFMLENCALQDDFNFYLTNVQRYAAYENKTKAIEKMLREIKAILGIQDIKDTPEEPPQIPEDADLKGGEPEEKTDTPSTQDKKGKAKTRVLKDKSKKKFNKKWVIIGAAVIAALAIIVGVVLSVLSQQSDFVVIAGQQFKTDANSVYLEDKTLTVEDINNFSKFEFLDDITLINCTLPNKDISTLFKTASSALSLNNCGITNEHLKSVNFDEVDPLFSFSLELDNNKDISDLSMIDIYSLNKLSFNNCSVSDLSFLSSMKDLTTLYAENNGISDISILSSLTELSYLNLANNEITQLNSLSECKELINVNVDYNKLSNLFGLENSLHLAGISAKGNALFFIDGLKNATQLQNVDLSENNIIDISILSKSSENLTEVDLSSNHISDISSLSICSKLDKLIIDKNQLTNLDALSELSELTKLSVSNNQITDIKGIKNCTFRYLDLSGNKIISTADISMSGSEIGRRVLDLSDNQITELMLPDISYEYLAIYGNPISNFSVFNDLTGMTMVLDYNANIDFFALGEAAGFIKYYVFDCPKDQQLNTEKALSYKTSFTTKKDFLDEEKQKLGYF